MHDLDFINYSTFFNGRIKAWQILSSKSNQVINLDKYRNKVVNQLSININNLAIPMQVHSDSVKFINESGFFKDTDVTLEGNILPLSETYFFNNLIFL